MELFATFLEDFGQLDPRNREHKIRKEVGDSFGL